MEDSVLVAINTLLAFVPEHYKPHVEAVLALMTSLSLLLAVWRPLFAWMAPKAAGSALNVMIDRALDWLAANSARIEVRKPVVRERRSTIPPPPKQKGVSL